MLDENVDQLTSFFKKRFLNDKNKFNKLLINAQLFKVRF